MKLLCRIFGHHWSIWSVTGAYAWCGWCKKRRNLLATVQSQPFDDVPSLAEIRAMAERETPTIH